MLPPVLALALLAAAPTSVTLPTSNTGARLRLEQRRSLTSFFPPVIAPEASLCLGGLCGAQLGVGGRFEIGRLVPALSSSFAHASATVRGDGRPALGLALGNAVSDKGLLVARLGYGLYMGRPKTPRSQLFVYYDQEVRLNGVGRPNSLFRDPRRGLGVDGTLFLTPQIGVQGTMRMGGQSWFAGASLVFRP